MSSNLPIQGPADFLARYGHWVSAGLHFATALLFVDFTGAFEIDHDEGFNLAKAALFGAGEPLYASIWSDQPHLLTVVLAGLHRLFPWSVEAARILILAVASGLVACVHFGAARVASDNLPVHQTRVPRLLAGFGAALLLVSTDRIISISFAVDVGTPAVALAAVAACVLLSASGHQRRSLFFASGVLLALACAAKLFVGPLLPVFLISIAVVGTRNSQLQRGRYYGVPAALCWWSTGFLTTLVLLFGPTFSPEMIEQLVMPHFRYQAGRSPLSAGIFSRIGPSTCSWLWVCRRFGRPGDFCLYHS